MKIIPLPRLSAGSHALITDLKGTCGFISRATAIGFTPGAGLLLVRNHKGLPLIVFLRDTQIVIDREESQGILVYEINA